MLHFMRMPMMAAAVLLLFALNAKRVPTPWDGVDWGKFEAFPVDKATVPFASAEEKNSIPDHIKAVQIRGVDFDGRASKFFCWYGVPESKNGKVPGIVLVHGGGGFAFSRWVEYWNNRGYAAIALDTCGNIPRYSWEGRNKKPQRNPEHGAREMEKYLVDIPLESQWSYQAVAEIMLAHSFLRSLENVDASKIGVTGVSWGGYLTTLVAGVDERFAFAIPVYGCGYMAETAFKKAMIKRKRTADDIAKWCKYWDAQNYLANAKMPMLFVNGACDFFFHFDAWVKTVSVPAKAYTALLNKMGHSHTQADVPVVRAFADAVTGRAKQLPECVENVVKDNKAYAVFKCDIPAVSASYNWLTAGASGKWNSTDVKISGGSIVKVEHTVPENAAAGYFSIVVKGGYPEKSGMPKGYSKRQLYGSSIPLYYTTNK